MRLQNSVAAEDESKMEEDCSLNQVNTPTGKSLRSNSTLYDKTRCIICQEPGGKLRMVAVKETGRKMFEVAKILNDPQFFLRLNSIPNAMDAIENDTRYHLTCWVKVQRKVQSSSCTVRELDNLSTVLAVDELVNTSKRSFGYEQHQHYLQ